MLVSEARALARAYLQDAQDKQDGTTKCKSLRVSKGDIGSFMRINRRAEAGNLATN
jgi:hypothetical protein